MVEASQVMLCFVSLRPPHPIAYFEDMLKKVDEIAVQIPLTQNMKEMVQRAKEWTSSAQILEVRSIGSSMILFG